MEGGNIRSGHQIFMDGMDVFNFALSVVPKSINEMMKHTQKTLADVDYIVFHQANKFMTDFFIKKLKYPLDKVPYCIDKYGNTSSASIPLTISSEIKTADIAGKQVVLCGFGAGLSWGTALIQFNHCAISPVIEY
jgi:3-oxoacyl-[acyl-carrier-protein] synthase-3